MSFRFDKLTHKAQEAVQLAQEEALTGDWRDLFTMIDKINAVTPADIQRIAKATFRKSGRTIVVMEPEQQRSDEPAVRPIAKATHHAVCAAIVLHLHHRVARAGAVRRVAPLRNDAIERRADLSEPALCLG